MVSGEWPSSFAFFALPLRSLRLRSFLKRKGRKAKPAKSQSYGILNPGFEL